MKRILLGWGIVKEYCNRDLKRKLRPVERNINYETITWDKHLISYNISTLTQIMYNGGKSMGTWEINGQSIGEIIKENRKRCNFLQKELAMELHISDSTLSNWEKNISRPNINQLYKLCRILYITPNQLLGIDPYKYKLESKDWKLINAYHNSKPEIQKSIDELLKIM